MERTVDNTFLHIARSRLVVHLTEQIRACLAALDDEQIWWRPNERSNAICNLILHCAGSTRYYIGHVVGGHDFVRDRDSEFGERQKMSKDALRIHLNSAVKEADEVLASFDPARLWRPRNGHRHPRPTCRSSGCSWSTTVRMPARSCTQQS